MTTTHRMIPTRNVQYEQKVSYHATDMGHFQISLTKHEFPLSQTSRKRIFHCLFTPFLPLTNKQTLWCLKLGKHT